MIVKPIIEKMLGLDDFSSKIKLVAKLGVDLKENGNRENYQRAILKNEDGNLMVYPINRQDSSLITELSRSNALIRRRPHAPALSSGQSVEVFTFYTEFS